MLARHMEPGKTKHRFTSPNFSDNDHCPFGCTKDGGECDERGLCDHYVGVTLEGNEVFHGVKYREYTNKEGQHVETFYDYLDGSRELKVTKKHKLVPITKNCRVYHPDGKASLETAEVVERVKPEKKKLVTA